MQGWSKSIIDKVNEIPIQIKKIKGKLNDPSLDETIVITLTIDAPDSLEAVNNIFESYDYTDDL